MDEHKLSDAIRKVERTARSVFHHAVDAVALSGLEPEDLPRLCISAACQSVETMLGRYQRVLAGQEEMSQEDRTTLRRTILATAADLQLAFQQAQDSVAAIMHVTERTTAEPTGEIRH